MSTVKRHFASIDGQLWKPNDTALQVRSKLAVALTRFSVGTSMAPSELHHLDNSDLKRYSLETDKHRFADHRYEDSFPSLL